MKTKRICKRLLLGIIILNLTGFFFTGWYLLDRKIPSVIHLRAGQEETLMLGIPAKGTLLEVSSRSGSNIPSNLLEMDLSREISFQADAGKYYRMVVKLFGVLPIKEIGVRIIDDCELIPVGKPIGIYVKTRGVLIVGTGSFAGKDGAEKSPAKGILKTGDYVLAMNGEAVSEKKDFIDRIEKSEGREVLLLVERDGVEMRLRVTPQADSHGKYKIGAWVRDNAQGIGTMTYMDADGNFGALGHGITDVDTSTLMKMEAGTLYSTQIIGVRRGQKGSPGEMTGMIIYSNERILGEITHNTDEGIYGKCNQKAHAMGDREAIPIALKHEVCVGNAKILCTVGKEETYYDVELVALNPNSVHANRGIELRVTDPELLKLTGGIVQGMSGSPIIQDGKLVGAVTHVLVNDPTRGYGIFIEEMLEAGE